LSRTGRCHVTITVVVIRMDPRIEKHEHSCATQCVFSGPCTCQPYEYGDSSICRKISNRSPQLKHFMEMQQKGNNFTSTAHTQLRIWERRYVIPRLDLDIITKTLVIPTAKQFAYHSRNSVTILHTSRLKYGDVKYRATYNTMTTDHY
jgi:hypothetical protein